MFDSVPPNLPVEPAQSAPPMPPTMPTAPTPPPMPLTTGQGKKEPEDIFKGLDMGSEISDKSLMPEIVEAGPKRNWLMVVGVGVAVLVVLGGVGYGVWFFIHSRQTAAPAAVTEKVATTTVEEQQVEQPPVTPEAPVTTPPAGTNIPTPDIQPTTTSSGEMATGTPAATEPIVTPLPVEGVDSDVDMLTDAEEALLGTNPSAKDTNGNGYDDGVEVKNLYDPLKKGSPLANASVMAWGKADKFRMLLPANWKLVMDIAGPSSFIVDTGTATRFKLVLEPGMGSKTLAEWLAKTANSGGLKPVTLKSTADAMQSADGLTTYLMIDGTIISVTYDLNGAQSYDYRTMYAMLLNSIQLVPTK